MKERKMKRKELADSTVSPGWGVAGWLDPFGVKRESAGSVQARDRPRYRRTRQAPSAFRRSCPQSRRRTQAHSRTGRDAGESLERLIEPLSRGDPESALRWTCK